MTYSYSTKNNSYLSQFRILVPSATAPPSGGPQGLWRRRTATGAVDAQGLGLSHPMTWLDERLFGWSRSAHRGNNVWDGGTPTMELSRAATPDVSDSGEEGDYDNVIAYLGSYTGLNSAYRTRSRSLRGSYADLQSLKLKDPAVNDTGWKKGASRELDEVRSHPMEIGSGANLQQHGQRTSPRVRKSSLSDSVPVEKPAVSIRPIIFKDLRICLL